MARCLYVHMPFCLKKCAYCDFLSVPHDPAFEKRYVEALVGEVRLGSPSRIKTVYLGGGTPTTLSAESLGNIFDALREGFDFSPGAEITVEANPGTVDGGKLDALLSLGVNRMSIGVQSFSDGELSFLGRTHTSEDAVKAVEAARRAGFKNISIDMIYGLPGQTLAGWRENLLKAVELAPEHVSAYELTPECGTPLYESVRRGLIKMPDEGLAIDMFEFASDFLAENGFTHYEVSNYALPGPRADKPGYECRHNLNYWERGEYLGLGAGAHSFLAGKRLRNTSDIEGYIARILRGDLPVEGVEEISPADAVREVIFLGLRKTAGFDMRKAGLERADEALSVLARDGLVEVDGYNLKATRRGLLLLNRVAASLIEGAEGNAARHSTGASERTARCSEPSAKKQPRTPVP